MTKISKGISIVGACATIGIIATLIVLSASIYSKKTTQHNNVIALHELKVVMEAEEAYYADNDKYTVHLADLERYGVYKHLAPGVKVILTFFDYDIQKYRIVTYHISGDKRYTGTGPVGPIDGQPSARGQRQ